ncbi:four-carbon acid sugar kinase family protein [Oceanicola sp. D3]|uniref:3-oxo-tetronate kinase n=1 Tax=Oceanicola sp. D3 TaxID=2587163 RepID=UPI00112459D9|nr:3-oxo-tetronate kinase [Oceanicola sp. D3]QDC11190.1 four-carbon acid sugar kinase family protein [Oceanicola sp. D3]
MAIFGAIADDFTGATDLAGLLARSGAKVSLRIGVPEEGESDAPFEVIALKIRTEPVADAVAEALAALEWLKGTGAERFFWKYCSTFDSTEEGNIGPVAEALMAALGARQTVYCPAFPENGRSVFMGNLFVGQQPLAESPMKDHPLTPMCDSNLMRLLAPQVKGEVGLVDRLTVARGAEALAAALAEAPAHVVVDAVADADLQVIARAGREMALMTGGSALAMPLPALYREAGLLDDSAREATAPQVGPGAVVLSGSCSAMTRAQVAAYGGPAFKLDPLVLAAEGHGAASNWLARQDVGKAPIIYATAEPDAVRRAQGELGTARAGEVVEAALAALAVQARGQGARRIVVAGGETSGAVTKALGVTRLDVGREIAPGVPWCGCVSGGEEIALALKSGNFGAESFFSDALGMLP